ncbi:hypothetical protein GQ53DRAFT_746958 [Thozetella sp. PMI_491]|nr:hypothetical protein GQ53DRAFT_746958 [Thozetella sp. PMI_491]
MTALTAHSTNRRSPALGHPPLRIDCYPDLCLPPPPGPCWGACASTGGLMVSVLAALSPPVRSPLVVIWMLFLSKSRAQGSRMASTRARRP